MNHNIGDEPQFIGRCLIPLDPSIIAILLTNIPFKAILSIQLSDNPVLGPLVIAVHMSSKGWPRDGAHQRGISVLRVGPTWD